MGVDFAKAALAAGNAVAASGHDPDAVSKVLGPSDDLLTVKLDVTKRGDAEAAVRAALDRFGRIDVLVNNAGSFYAGYFAELTPERMERQLETSLIGPMNVTRLVFSGYAQAALSTSAEQNSSSFWNVWSATASWTACCERLSSGPTDIYACYK